MEIVQGGLVRCSSEVFQVWFTTVTGGLRHHIHQFDLHSYVIASIHITADNKLDQISFTVLQYVSVNIVHR